MSGCTPPGDTVIKIICVTVRPCLTQSPQQILRQLPLYCAHFTRKLRSKEV